MMTSIGWGTRRRRGRCRSSRPLVLGFQFMCALFDGWLVGWLICLFVCVCICSCL